MPNKRCNFNIKLLLIAVMCGSFMLPSQSDAAKKKKKSTSTPTITNACIACLNSFDPETLKFSIDEEKCIKRIPKCFKKDLSSQCEVAIQECIQYNCSTAGSCADEMGNRALFAGCLKATNQVLPYQCANYIAGYASSKAAEVKAVADAQQLSLKEKQEATKAAAAAAEKAKADAEIKAKQIEKEAEAKAKQIEGENERKLAETQSKLKLKEEEARIAREKKEALEAKNNKPNVKYNNLLNAVKQDISTAKNYTNKAYNLLGITKTDKSTASNQGSAIFFAPQVINIPGIMAGSDAKTRALVNASRYKSDQNFVCTKNTKENIIRNELNNVYNTIKKSRDNLSNGISEIEATNADDEAVGTISESKVNTLYMAQNKLTEIMETIEGYTSQLKTSCETRCEGMSSMPSTTSSISSTPIQFDENGNIIEEKKKTDDNTYSCKDFENDNSSQNTSIAALFTGNTSSTADMFGGIGKKVTELTKRNTQAVLETDKLLDEALIAAQNGKFGESVSDYPAIDSCTQYMVLDIAQYTNCASNVLGQQFTALSSNKENEKIKEELNKSIDKIIKTLGSPNYAKKLENIEIYCPKKNTTTATDDNNNHNKISADFNYSYLYDYDALYTCISSLTNALNEAKKEKTTTGNSNFQIVDYANGAIILHDGTSWDPTSFAINKLGWEDVSSCSVIAETKKSQISTLSGSQTIDSGEINMARSILSCTCDTKTVNKKNFQQLNFSNAGESCNEKGL